MRIIASVSFWENLQHTGSCVQKDVQFSSGQLYLLRQPSSRTFLVPAGASMEAGMDVVRGSSVIIPVVGIG